MDNSSTSTSPVSIGSLKHDPAWKHCEMFKNGDKVQLKCLYCLKVFSGGGIHRIKEHLACQKGNASCCLKVPNDVRIEMLKSLEIVMLKKRKKQKMGNDIRSIVPSGVNANTPACLLPVVRINPIPIPDARMEMRKKEIPEEKFLPVNTGSTWPSSNVGTIVIPGKEKDAVHVAISWFLYDVGLSLDAVNSPYFQPMIDAIAKNGTAVEGPSYHDVRGWILKNSVNSMNELLDKYKATWERNGCSVLVDEWTIETGRTLLNIFVHCAEGTMYLKTFDVSETLNSPDVLYEIFKGVVEEVGVSNVLQVITDGAEHYLIAGGKLTETFRTMYWTPCAARSLNLMLEDVGKIEGINVTLEQAKSVTRFVYNHGTVLNIIRRHTVGRDLVQPMITRSATDCITLKNMVHLKDNLQVMVNSQEWIDCPLSKDPEGISMMEIILSQSFWSSCSSIIRLTDPLVGLLRSVSSAKRPSVGYVLAGIHRVKETIKRELIEEKTYMVYWKIIDRRWNLQLQHPLHEAGFFLNPKLYYSLEGDVRDKIPSGMLDCIERLVPDINVQDKINKELISYKNAVGDFGRKMATRAAHTLLPAEWWSTYGGGCPNLTRLAIRILSQTCSATTCRLGFLPFEQLYRTKNTLERQRLCDLLFVQCNLRLQQVNLKNNKEPGPMDPISTENIELAEEWVTKKLECLGSGDSDWISLRPPMVNTMIVDAQTDEAEDLVPGFDYQERPQELLYDEDNDMTMEI
ncbi:hypothetical protein ACHQM5_020190 [Ranunculus cassubicifolius]